MDSWDYEEYLDVLEYKPGRNGFFHILQPEGALQPIVEEGVLNSRNLAQYISKDVISDRPLLGGIRLIYSNGDPENFSNDKTVFWSRSDFVKIMESFRLPRRFTQMIGACHCMFAQCQPERADGEEERISYIFSTMFNHNPFWCLAASWDPKTRITYAFLHCTSDPKEECIPRIKQFLARVPQHATQPMLLPVLIMDLETNLTLHDDEDWTNVVLDIEEKTRQRPRESEQLDPRSLDLPLIVQKLNGCSVFLSLIERESEAVLLHLELARKITLSLQAAPPGHEELTRKLIMHIDFLVESRKNVLLRLQNLQRRSQTQLAFVYNIAAQPGNM